MEKKQKFQKNNPTDRQTIQQIILIKKAIEKDLKRYKKILPDKICLRD